MLILASVSTYLHILSVNSFLKSYILLASEEKQPAHFFFSFIKCVLHEMEVVFCIPRITHNDISYITLEFFMAIIKKHSTIYSFGE